MKLLIISTVFLLISLSEQLLPAEDLKRISETCMAETGMSRDKIIHYMTTLNFVKSDKLYKQYLSCSYKKQGYQHQDGSIDYQNLQISLQEVYEVDDLVKVLTPCKQLKGRNDGENAFMAMVCIIGNLKELEANQSDESANKKDETIRDSENEIESNA